MNKMEENNLMADLVVGIGASAGGLEALRQFFDNMSTISNLAFVVVQHLSSDYKSLLAEILSKDTSMSVEQASNGMDVLPNHVYLIPPKNNMIMQDGRLFLKEYAHGALNHPIDVFLNSMAEDKKENCIAVILSGSGSDGTNGIKAVKEAGGLVIVQDPLTAKFDGMPRSAINTGLADFILNPGKIAEEIGTFARHPAPSGSGNNVELFSGDDLLQRIYNILKRVSKIDYTHYKQSTVIRRIERRMAVTHQQSLKEYVNMLEASPPEAKTLGREIPIGVTSFFRDQEYFEILKTHILTPLLTDGCSCEPLRM